MLHVFMLETINVKFTFISCARITHNNNGQKPFQCQSTNFEISNYLIFLQVSVQNQQLLYPYLMDFFIPLELWWVLEVYWVQFHFKDQTCMNIVKHIYTHTHTHIYNSLEWKLQKMWLDLNGHLLQNLVMLSFIQQAIL